MQLQASISATSAGLQIYPVHHPITCPGQLSYEEDGSFSCPHATIAPDDVRTQHCLDSSIAILIFEEAWKKFGV